MWAQTKSRLMDASWQYKHLVQKYNIRTCNSVAQEEALKEPLNHVGRRARPVWLHLITIFFSKKMFFSAVKIGIAGGIMFQYHARLGLYLLLLAACLDFM